MPRRVRTASGGLVYHVFNRSARKLPIFECAADYAEFTEVVAEAQRLLPMRIASYCVMPNHWHLVLWPEADRDLSRFMAWLTTTHAVRWRTRRGTTGQGAVYQGRFKAVPVQCDNHFLVVCRYVERNPVRAGLIARAVDWPWSSSTLDPPPGTRPVLCQWPVPQPANWRQLLQEPEPLDAVVRIRKASTAGEPIGRPDWQTEVRRRLGITWPRPPVGRPRVAPAKIDSRPLFRG
jgi:putative transposase